MPSRFIVTSTLAALLCGATAPAQIPAPPRETPAERDARMAWWRDARFGMFIHWGLYAIPAGSWNGHAIPGIGEWIMDRANIPVADYEKLAAQFNPTAYDPEEWVRLARDAGMKYIVITSKHHDGFTLFDTDTTAYDAVDATPYGKDLLLPLSEACRKYGLKFCTYYSIMDWHHPAQYRHDENRYNPTRIHPDRKDEYIQYMKQQLADLLDSSNPEVLWFDGEWPDWFTREDGWELYHWLRNRKPSLIINNRIGSGRQGMEGFSADDNFAGDFGTPEQQIPATGLAGVDWETCMTMNDTWGFKQDDHNWKSTETLIRQLIDATSKGGNYLLNVGPTAEGRIPDPSIERLRGIAAWMAANGESIHGAAASPFADTPWGRCTQKTDADGNTRLYLHIFDWPQDGALTLPASTPPPRRASLLATGADVPIAGDDGRTILHLPTQPPDPIATVVVLDMPASPR
jgi:alpha-L-fucosidase